MAKRGEAQTLSVAVYDRLRRDVLSGHYRPGARLKPAALGATFGVSVGVIREALTRLAQQQLVTSSHNQGFRVASLSPQELQDLTEMRVTIEGLALRLAIERGDLQWESEVLAAHYRLANTPRRTAEDPDRTSEVWSIHHRTFHTTLIGACAVPPLLDVCEQLSDATELYRHWSAPASGGRRDVAAEHRRLMQTALDRDVSAAMVALRDHYERTTAIVLASGLLLRCEEEDAMPGTSG